ncbi:hypothetical protein KUV26_04210 [Leisingera daeponensis]|uniref:Uncharacterized protein n=1 Tax=Leisingera daeponensis TaxID=405746 RepID=A0ABS7NBQ0_9RHOB|nr:hypothetical protein [Leisingera daeponensis]MBY6138631.1 hypothetical protein [Leisingera daeponensis]
MKKNGPKYFSVVGVMWLVLGLATLFVGKETLALMQIGLGIACLVVAAFKNRSARREAQP